LAQRGPGRHETVRARRPTLDAAAPHHLSSTNPPVTGRHSPGAAAPP